MKQAKNFINLSHPKQRLLIIVQFVGLPLPHMNRRLSLFVLIALLSLGTGCVSKRKYQALDSDLRAQREVSQNYHLRIDTLQMVNAQLRDSIIYLDSMLVVERSRNKKVAPAVKPTPKKSTLSASEEYSKKSVFISTFGKNVIWPEKYLGQKFIIGVVGDSPLFNEMKKSLEGKTMNGKIIEVRKFTSANVTPVHILFIAHAEIGNFQKIKNALGINPVLLVTEEGEKGYANAHINFYLDENKVQYSLNKPLAEQAGLKVTQELVRFSDK
jgi:hypothetical protein